MARFFMAQWAPLSTHLNYNPAKPMEQTISGLVLHMTGGSNVAGTKSTFEAPHVTPKDRPRSAHFCCPRVRTAKPYGTLTQFIDTGVQAWAQEGGNPRWISIENEGVADEDALTGYQIEMCAYVLAWLHLNQGVPIAVADRTDARGLAYHKMFSSTKCPGTAVVNQRGQIVTQAEAIAKSPAKYALQWP